MAHDKKHWIGTYLFQKCFASHFYKSSRMSWGQMLLREFLSELQRHKSLYNYVKLKNNNYRYIRCNRNLICTSEYRFKKSLNLLSTSRVKVIPSGDCMPTWTLKNYTEKVYANMYSKYDSINFMKSQSNKKAYHSFGALGSFKRYKDSNQ